MASPASHVLFLYELDTNTKILTQRKGIIFFCNFFGNFPASGCMPTSPAVIPHLQHILVTFYEVLKKLQFGSVHCITFHHEILLEDCGSLIVISPREELTYLRTQFCVDCTWITSFTESMHSFKNPF